MAITCRQFVSLLLLGLALGCAGDPDESATADAGAITGADAGVAPLDASTPTDGNAAYPDSATSDAGGNTDSATPAITDFSAPGPFDVESSSGSATVEGCTLEYDLYAPAGASNAPLMVLGHGFQRTKANVAAIAVHVATHGLRVAVPSFCHSTIFDTNHAQNGVDAASLAAQLADGEPVILAGHSAGGAAAFVAAVNTENLVGVVGLDAVDAADVAADAAPLINVPVFGLVGESNGCNSNNNGIPLYDLAPMGWAVRVTGGSHCDFEDPTEALCTTFCGNADINRQTLVRSLLAAFACWASHVDESGAEWVQASGSRYQQLVSDGAIAPL